MSGPRTEDVSGWPGAPGVGSGGDSGPTPPIKSGVVGDNDFLQGGVKDATVEQAFPGAVPQTLGGVAGDTWQETFSDDPEVNVSTINDQPGHPGQGIRVTHPAAFYPGLGQGV